jgi:chromosome segregation ATPase
MLKEEDVTIKCRQCGKEFLFTKAEQAFYEEKGFNTPRRCKECRTTEKIHHEHLSCSRCGTELEEDSTVYCDTCFTNTELEAELKNKNIQEEIEQVYTRLKAIESENTELKEELDCEKTLVSELEENIDILNQELEKVNQLHATLSEWFEPTLNKIEKKLGDRLERLERGQNRINERMLQLVEKIHEMHENTTLLEILKQSFRHHQKQDKQPI